MVTVSLCMIVKNEEDVLARCLESAADLVEEIIIVDTGSTDRTREIAERFTDRVCHFDWTDDFAAARNYAFSLAEKDYCMWLDADDVMTEGDRAIFRELKETLDPAVCVVMAKYNTGFDENGNVTFSYFRERLIKNHSGMRWEGAVHEAISPVGQVIYSDFAVTHRKLHPSDPDRNLRIYKKQLEQGIKLDPRQQFYYGRELYYHKRYEDAVRVFERFLDEGRGWLENRIDACCHCACCYERMDRPEKALDSLLRSFAYDRPRAEVCCELGRWFFQRENMPLAAYWYSLALTCPRNDARGGFVSPDCYGYLPCIQLCVCYSRMGDLERAAQMNELAASFKPDAAPVLHNRTFFQSLAAGK
ncbi:MAG: glycosyltransferase [Oscillospiraceae bacterium]|jgi:glycosyltransferase involved in cell wall biosynthesis|nr:glycosyltransferase [Oscillospiraceae bacterium]